MEMALDRVLIIDDDRFVQKVLQRSLVDHYETKVADCGEAGLTAAEEWQPNIILLDVEMPGRNGYEVCDELKRGDATGEIPVVFLSSKSSLRERMLGYEVGGDDYLVKPCETSELLAKLQRLNHHFQAKKALAESAQSAQQTAMEAMATSFELGKSVRFVESSYGAGSFDELGSMLMSFCRDLQLSAVAMFVSRQGFSHYSTGASVCPLESEVLMMLHEKDRFVDFGCRTQVNYPQVSLLIKNMPLEDRARYGRIKDTLPFVLGAADAKVRVIDAEASLLSQTTQLATSVDVVQMTLASMGDGLRNGLKTVANTMSNLLSTLSVQMQSMGFDEDQEAWVNEQVEKAATLIHSCTEENSAIEGVLSELVQMLERLTREQSRIISETLSSARATIEDTSNDVELF